MSQTSTDLQRARSRSPVLRSSKRLVTQMLEEVEQAHPVYPVKKKASGRAGAGLHANQIQFMQLMGLADPKIEAEGVASWQCNIAEDELEVLRTASRHVYVKNLRREGENDGLLLDEALPGLFGIPSEQVEQCRCAAHQRLELEVSESERDDLKVLIRSTELLTVDSGPNYACSLVRRLFSLMGMPRFKAERSGHDYGVSYVLLFQRKKYAFRGYPDFIVHEEDVGAGRMLVATGEIQSTQNPDVQNSIYAVGCLLKNLDPSRPILCLIIYKNKCAQLAVARLSPGTCEEEEIEGSVSLKYVVSPSPMDLRTAEGIKTLATRLRNMLPHT